jgi:precorrin-2/cobalt-factor-2 C20-methyltransferase
MPAILYGVGVGPGDPELMTIKAARILAAVPVVAYFHKRGKHGYARTIVEGHLARHAVEMAFEYPLTTEVPYNNDEYRTALTEFYDQAAGALARRLEEGSDVAVLCEGDPFFYGSFLHLHHRLIKRHNVEVIPGVTGMSGCWTRSGRPISYGDDVLEVLPGTLSEANLAERMRKADAFVIMKLGRNLAKVRRALAAAGLCERAIYVEHGTMEDEVILPLARKTDDEAPYFSMILVPGRGRRL